MLLRRWSTIGLLAVFIFATGFFVGQRWKRLPDKTVVHNARTVTASMSTEIQTVPHRTTADETEVRYRELLTQLSTPARDDELVAAIERLAEQYPLRAVALALAEKNSRLRDRLLDAALRGWGKMDAAAAADWVLSKRDGEFDHNAAIASVFKGAVTNPEDAVRLAQTLCSRNPDEARDYGDALIYAFAQNGNFPEAAAFAVGSDEPQMRTEWLAAAYGSWASYQPQVAAASALQLDDEAARTDALNAVITQWGQVDPQNLAQFAEDNLPDGNQKTLALSQATIFWAAKDPTAVAQWINQTGSSPEMDPGEAAIATQPQVMQQPLVAISWAETITDPNLRSRTVSAIAETWVLSNPSAAIAFVQTTTDLLSTDRADLLSRIGQ